MLSVVLRRLVSSVWSCSASGALPFIKSISVATPMPRPGRHCYWIWINAIRDPRHGPCTTGVSLNINPCLVMASNIFVNFVALTGVVKDRSTSGLEACCCALAFPRPVKAMICVLEAENGITSPWQFTRSDSLRPLQRRGFYSGSGRRALHEADCGPSARKSGREQASESCAWVRQ